MSFLLPIILLFQNADLNEKVLIGVISSISGGILSPFFIWLFSKKKTAAEIHKTNSDIEIAYNKQLGEMRKEMRDLDEACRKEVRDLEEKQRVERNNWEEKNIERYNKISSIMASLEDMREEAFHVDQLVVKLRADLERCKNDVTDESGKRCKECVGKCIILFDKIESGLFGKPELSSLLHEVKIVRRELEV